MSLEMYICITYKKFLGTVDLQAQQLFVMLFLFLPKYYCNKYLYVVDAFSTYYKLI